MNPADTAGCQVSPACRAGSAPCLALPPRSSGLASLQRLHPRPHRVPRPPGDCTDKSDCESERGRVARGKLFHNLPESTRGGGRPPVPAKIKKKKNPSLPQDNSNTQAKEAKPCICGLPLTASNFAAAAANLPQAHFSALASPPLRGSLPLGRRLGLAQPRLPLPHPPGSPGGRSPTWPGLPVPGRAGLSGAPGADSLGKPPSSSRACPTHLCLLHKERQRCDPAQAAVWRLRLAVLELQHIARAAAADSPSIG